MLRSRLCQLTYFIRLQEPELRLEEKAADLLQGQTCAVHLHTPVLILFALLLCRCAICPRLFSTDHIYNNRCLKSASPGVRLHRISDVSGHRAGSRRAFRLNLSGIVAFSQTTQNAHLLYFFLPRVDTPTPAYQPASVI